MHRVLMSGTLPENLPVQLAAYYSTLHPEDGENGYADCYHSGFSFSRNLHLTEPIQVVRHGPRYEASVALDKYQPGRCGWVLVYVGYKVTERYGGTTGNPGWPAGTATVSIANSATILRDAASTRYWRGPVDIWCSPQICGLLVEMSGVDAQGVPASELSTQHTTWIFPDTHSVTVNFHDLDTPPAAN